jgi:hypothetical protein
MFPSWEPPSNDGKTPEPSSILELFKLREHLFVDAERNATMAYLDGVVTDRGGRRGRAQLRTPTSGLTWAVSRHAPRAKEEWIAVPCPAIINEATFVAAARACADNTNLSARRLNPDEEGWLLRGLVFCACGTRSIVDRGGSSQKSYAPGDHNA